MEYFAKFTRRIATPKSAAATAATMAAPGGASQLAKFEKAWSIVQAICCHKSKWVGIRVEKTPVASQIGTMIDLLVQEDIRKADTDDSTAGACMEYILGNNVLDSLVKLADADIPVGVRGVVVNNLATFVNLTDDKILVQKAVHNPILELLRLFSARSDNNDDDLAAIAKPDAIKTSSPRRISSTLSIRQQRQRAYDDDFVDLMYAICSKIRGEPMLLNIFFQDLNWIKSVEQQRGMSSDSITSMVREVNELHFNSSDKIDDISNRPKKSPVEKPQNVSSYEFILFSQLLRFIHVEGKAGDTARTSLLFLLELASTEIMASGGGKTALERFILGDSGFSAIVSASLGALYSQLPHNVSVSSNIAAIIPESLPSYTADLQNAIESSIFTTSNERWNEDRGMVNTNNREFQSRLASFAQLLSFIQDVLYRCPSRTICKELLMHTRNNFLQAILYPSLLESSDTDGSSVAVMLYLETMLQVAQHEDLVSTIMNLLTDSNEDGGFGIESGPTNQTDYLPFTLRDLICTNLQSTVSVDAVISALKLLRIILSKHCRYTSRLFEMEKVLPSGVKNGWMMNYTVAIDVHRQELEMYAKLVGQLEGRPSKSSVLQRGTGPDARSLHIPWRANNVVYHRSDDPETNPRGGRVSLSDVFYIGYDEYLEDAALDWDAHEAYHSEIDALLAAKRSLREGSPIADSSHSTIPSPLNASDHDIVSPLQSVSSKRGRRPRKYSEAVAVVGIGIDSKESNKPASTDIVPQDWKKLIKPATARKDKTQSNHTESAASLDRPLKPKHHIKSSDPLIRALMNLMAKYFSQSRECNLALTSIMAALVGCPHRTLDPWLGFDLSVLLNGVLHKPWNQWLENLQRLTSEESESDSDGEEDVCGRNKRRQGLGRNGGMSATATLMTSDASKFTGLDQDLQNSVNALPRGTKPPLLYVVISGLVQQAQFLRNEIPDFPHRLKRARNALMGIVEDADDLDEEFESRNRTTDNGGMQVKRDRGLSSASISQRNSPFGMDEEANDNAPASPVLKSGSRRAQGNANSPHLLSPSMASKELISGGVSELTNINKRKGMSDDNEIKDAHANSSPVPDATSSIISQTTGVEVESASQSYMNTAASGSGSSMSGSWQDVMSTPPANVNIAEFLENLIILQESIKEIIARVQVRRENGGDEGAIF